MCKWFIFIWAAVLLLGFSALLAFRGCAPVVVDRGLDVRVSCMKWDPRVASPIVVSAARDVGGGGRGTRVVFAVDEGETVRVPCSDVAGSYTIGVVGSPVLGGGRVYRVPDEVTVDYDPDDGAARVVEIDMRLEPRSEVTEGQLIAAGYSKYLADKMKDEGKEYLYG